MRPLQTIWLLLWLMLQGIRSGATEGWVDIPPFEKQALRKAVFAYAGCYNVFKLEPGYPTAEFVNLFIADTVRIRKDFSDFALEYGSPGQCYDAVKRLLLGRRVKQYSIELTRPPDYTFDRDGNDYYVFLHKAISYRDVLGNAVSLDCWERLQLRWVNGGFLIAGIARVSEPGEMPVAVVVQTRIKNYMNTKPVVARDSGQVYVQPNFYVAPTNSKAAAAQTSTDEPARGPVGDPGMPEYPVKITIAAPRQDPVETGESKRNGDIRHRPSCRNRDAYAEPVSERPTSSNQRLPYYGSAFSATGQTPVQTRTVYIHQRVYVPVRVNSRLKYYGGYPGPRH